MIDKEHESINYKLIFNWVGLASIGLFWWYSLFTNGVFQTIMWSVVIIAIVFLISILKQGSAR